MKSIVARDQKVHIIKRAKPTIKPSYLLIKTLYSVISPGTELSLIGVSEDREITLGYSAVGVVMECGEGVEDYQKGDIVACYGAPYVGHSECLLVPTTLCAKGSVWRRAEGSSFSRNWRDCDSRTKDCKT